MSEQNQNFSSSEHNENVSGVQTESKSTKAVVNLSSIWEKVAALIIPKTQNGWIGLGVVIAGLFAAGYVLNALDNRKEGEVTTHLVGKYIAKAKELVSIHWHYRNASEYKDKDGLIREGKKILVVYEGKVLIGVDLAESKIDVDNNSKRISLTLPKAKILAHEIYERTAKKYDVEQGFLTKGDVDYWRFFKEFGPKNKRQIEREIERNEVMVEAEKSAVDTIISMLSVNEQIANDYEIIVNNKVVKQGKKSTAALNTNVNETKPQETQTKNKEKQ